LTFVDTTRIFTTDTLFALVPVLKQDLLTFKNISLKLLCVGHQIVIAFTYEHLKKQFRKHRKLWHCLS